MTVHPRGGPLRVLVIPEWYPSSANPVAGVFVQDQVRAVSDRHAMTVLLHERGHGPARIVCEQEGVRTIRLRTRQHPGTTRGRLAFLIKAFGAVRHMHARREPPDIVHAHVFSAGFIALLLSHGRYPVVLSEHHSDFIEGKVTGRDALVARLVLRRAQLVCAVSDTLRSALERFEPGGHYEVVPNVVDLAAFAAVQRPSTSGDAPLRLLVVAMLGDQKGVPYLLQALAELGEQARRFTLDILGDGPSRPELERLAGQLPAPASVTFHGIRPRHEVAKAMAAADVLVLPSVVETFGVAMIEALAVGLPIITTTAVPGSDLISGRFGIVVPPADAGALKDAIVAMREQHRSFPRHSAEELLSSFSSEAVGRRWDAIYRALHARRTIAGSAA